MLQLVEVISPENPRGIQEKNHDHNLIVHNKLASVWLIVISNKCTPLIIYTIYIMLVRFLVHIMAFRYCHMQCAREQPVPSLFLVLGCCLYISYAPTSQYLAKA